MESRVHGKETTPSANQSNNNNSRGNPNNNMYLGFGRLFSHHLPVAESNELGYSGDRLEPTPFAEDASSGHNAQKIDYQDDQKIASGAPKKPPAGKKRRRTEEADDAAHHERSYVHHEYHDYSGLSGGPVVLPTLRQKGRGGVSSMFPTVLHHMLDEAEKQGFAQVVSWQPHGRAFHVHMPEKFVSEVMPNYFRHTRLSSFQRQLSLYGFTRLARKGPDRGAYYHECFLRGMVHLCSNMQRTRVKGTMVRQSSSPETEPDFSVLPPVGVEYAKSTGSLLATRSLPPQPEAQCYSSKAGIGKGGEDHTNTFNVDQAMPQLTYNDVLFRSLQQEPPKKAQAPMPARQEQANVTSTMPRLEETRNTTAPPPPPPPGRAWGSKYMRHLMVRDTATHEDKEGSSTAGRAKKQEESRSSSSDTEGESHTSDDGSTKTPNKVDADLAVFLEEVDLESDQDECLESEEAMARILEQEVGQVSEV